MCIWLSFDVRYLAGREYRCSGGRAKTAEEIQAAHAAENQVVSHGGTEINLYRWLIYIEYSRNEDKYTDKDGSELENKAELVWEGQVRMQFDCHKSDLEIVTPAFK